MTWATLRARCEEVLAKAGRERPARLVLDWFDDVYGRASRRGAEEVPRANVLTVEAELARLAEGWPLQYVTGVAHFYGLELDVGEGVLIPRPETEELVRWILEAYPTQAPLRFADVCCGSGCIAVALARKRLAWRGVAVDVSEFALDYTRRNLRKHDLENHVAIERADVTAKWLLSGGPFDIIVSNPPYIPGSDWDRVDASVATHEPVLALRVEDADPLLFYRRIAEEAGPRMTDAGWLYFECNDRYTGAVAAMLRQKGWVGVEIFTDMQARQRHVRARFKITDGETAGA